MQITSHSRLRLSTAGGLLAVIVLSVATSAQQRQEPRGFPDDWSHQHLIFPPRKRSIN